MKRTLSTLLLAALSVAGVLRADTVLPAITVANEAGTSLPPLGSYTSLGCVTVGAATSSLSLSATGGILFVITGTSQPLAQWATGTGPWQNSLQVFGNGFLKKQGDLLRFVGAGSNTNTAWACISYRTVYPDGSTVISGPVTVTGTGNITSAVPLTLGAFVNSAATVMDQLTTSAASADAVLKGATSTAKPFYFLLAQTATPAPTALPTPAGGYASQSLQQTQIAYAAQTPTPVPTATPQARITVVAQITFSVNTTPQAFNLSSTAGVPAAGYIWQVQGVGNCSALYSEVDFSSSASGALTSGRGTYIPASPTGGIAYGPFGSGAHAKIRATSGTCDGSASIMAIP